MENSRILKLVFILILIMNMNALFSQTSKPTYKKLEIDPLTVSYIEITPIKMKKQKVKAKKLNKLQSQEFVKTWNNTNTIVNCEGNFSYTVAVYYQDLSKKDFYLEKSILSDNKSNCVDSKILNYADKLYKGK